MPDAKINILFVSTAVSLMENLFLKHLGYDYELICENCQSRDYELHETDKGNELLFFCKSCNSTRVLPIVNAL